MSKTKDNIRRAFEALHLGFPQNLPAKVKEVSGETCTLDFEGLEIYDVKLRASENGEESKFLLKPKVGSWVMMSRIQHSKKFFVSMVSEVDEVFITSNLTQFNSGEFGGLIKIKELVGKVNALESDINSLKDIFLNWTPSSNDGGLALKTAIAINPTPNSSYAGKKLSNTKVEELENKKVTHG